MSKSYVIECSRINSIDVQAKGLENDDKRNNARWINKTNLKIETNDQVNVQLATIHSIGSDTSQVVEIIATENKLTGLERRVEMIIRDVPGCSRVFWCGSGDML